MKGKCAKNAGDASDLFVRRVRNLIAPARNKMIKLPGNPRGNQPVSAGTGVLAASLVGLPVRTASTSSSARHEMFGQCFD